MSSNEKTKGKTNFFEAGGLPHESLTLESNEDGTVSIKFYSYQEAINNEAFAAKLLMIENSLNSKGFYIQGRKIKEGFKATPEGEIKESAKGEVQVTVKSKDMDTAINGYKKAKNDLK